MCTDCMNSRVKLVRARVVIGLFGMAALIGALAPPARAEVFTEVHVYDLDLADVDFGGSYSPTFDMALFDTLGGTRELVAVGHEVFFGNYYWNEIFDNDTPDYVGCEWGWSSGWQPTVGGENLLPWANAWETAGLAGVSGAYGVVRSPFQAGRPPQWRTKGWSPWPPEQLVVDPTYLAMVTGVGTVGVLNSCWVSDAAINPVPPEVEPPPGTVFDPDIMHVGVDTILMDLTVTYYWTPEPGSLSLFAVAGSTLLRRRR